MNNSCDGVSEKAMLLNKIVNHDLCFVCEQVRAIFSSIHGELRFGPPGRDRYAAWGVLQFTHTLERSATPRRALLPGGIRRSPHPRISYALEAPPSERNDRGHRLGRRLANHPLPDRPP